MAFFSKIRSERRRIAVIHSGSPFIQEISLTTSSDNPRLALKTYVSASKNPYFSR
jgi:hypothetical protein